MPVDLGPPYMNDWKGRPAHMSSLDQPLWERFQAAHGSEYELFYFDASLGTPSEVAADAPPELAKMWTRITSKRMDVVGRKPGEWWILEMRPNASSGALGTVLTYRELWRSAPPDSDPVRAAIVTDRPDPDLLILAPKNDILIITV